MRKSFRILAALFACGVLIAADSGNGGQGSGESQQSGGNPDPAVSQKGKDASEQAVGNSRAGSAARSADMAAKADGAAGAAQDAVGNEAAAAQQDARDATDANAAFAKSHAKSDAQNNAVLNYIGSFSQQQRTAAVARIASLAGYSNSKIDPVLARQRDQIAVQQQQKDQGNGSRGGLSFTGTGSDSLNDRAGLSPSEQAGSLAKQYTVLALPNPVLMWLLDRQAQNGIPAWCSGDYSPTSLRMKIWGWAKENFLVIFQLIAIAFLVVKFLWFAYTASSRDAASRTARQLIVPCFLFMSSLLMIQYGTAVMAGIRSSLAMATASMITGFNNQLNDDGEGDDVSRFYTLAKFINAAETSNLINQTQNEDLTLDPASRDKIQSTINSTMNTKDRDALFGDFCVYRLAVYDANTAYAKAIGADGVIKEGVVAVTPPIQKAAQDLENARKAMMLFIDKNQLMKGEGWFAKLTNYLVNNPAWALDSAYNAHKRFALAGQTLGIFVTAYAVSFLTFFVVDLAFIFICISIPLRVIAVDNPKALFSPLIEAAAVSVFMMFSAIFRSIGVHYIAKAFHYESAFSDLANMAINSVTGATRPVDMTGSSEYLVAIIIGGVFLIFGQTILAWLLMKMIFPKVTVAGVADQVYAGGSALVGGALAAGGAVAGGVMMFTPAAPAAGAVAGGGAAAGKAVSGRKGKA